MNAWTRDRGRGSLLALLIALLAGPAAGAGETADGRAPEPRPLHRTGFYLGIGSGMTDVNLDLDPDSPLAAPQFDLNGPRASYAVHLGYGAGPHFATELEIRYAELDDAGEGIHLIQFGSLGIVRLGPPRPAQFYLRAGVGGLVVATEESEVGAIGDLAVIGDMGLGLLWRLNGRFVLDLGYRLAVANFERQFLDNDKTRPIGGEGHNQTLGAQLSFDF